MRERYASLDPFGAYAPAGAFVISRGGIITTPTITKPQTGNGFMDHFRAETPEAREAAFHAYLDRSVPYFEKVREKGDQPWFHTEDERRVLFFARYDRPKPPAGLPPITSLRDFHNRNN
ncbi:hypothetical protein [Rhodococcus rhodochrous]|uniref:hypothetical protein n=1 Tax=Rhodococcus rhodochrous TaxID=1829 RepID=UPI0024B9E1A4|nr:hypothetical protein [Rhodococcus rhodochrous]MDJ0400886.1 hypothetical protein [Rhodococcus rhodochrous]